MSALLSNSPALNAAGPQTLARGKWQGIDFAVSKEDITAAVDWRIHDSRDIAIVHLHGHIASLETEMDGCGAQLAPPMPGELWIVPAGTRYCSRAQGRHVRYAEIAFDVPRLTALTSLPVPSLQIRPRTAHFDEFFYRAVQRLEALAQQDPPDSLAELMASTLSQTLMLHFYREFADDTRNHRSPFFSARLQPGEVRRLTDYIAAHLDRPLTLDALAALVNRKPHDFLIAFRAEFSTTPAQYVIAQRLRMARWLLSRTSKSVAAIAYETGFASHSHLSTSFKSRYGCTPNAFRSTSRR